MNSRPTSIIILCADNYLNHSPASLPQVRCSSLPWALSHQAVSHPLTLLRLPFRKLERQERESGAAPIPCPLMSNCSCLIRKSSRLARHVGLHSPQLLDLAVAVAKEAEARATELVGKGSATESAALQAQLPAHIKATGVDTLSFACPCCTALVAPASLGLPR